MFDPQNPYCLFRPGSPSFCVLLGSCILFLLLTPVFIFFGGTFCYGDPWPSSNSTTLGISYGVGLGFVIATVLGLAIAVGLILLILAILASFVRQCEKITEEVKNSQDWIRANKYEPIPE